MKARSALVALLGATVICALSLARTTAQTAEFLSLDSEGSASVYSDEQRSTAFLVDGGRKGSLVRPRLDAKPVLAALLDRGMKHLVVTCSHPHDDHAAGLLEIIETDLNITKFESVVFVDSDYPQAQSLYRRFTDRWPQFPKEKVRYETAKKRNAFAFLGSSNGNCEMSNFVYDPPQNPSNVHGQTIITTTELSKDGNRTRVVDFDDASSELVAQWAAWAKQDPPARRPDVIIAAHHSSDLTDITPLLDVSIKPKACVITANSGNRFVHPGPANWLKLVDSLGIENVHVTAVGNIAVTQNGVSPAPAETHEAIRTQVVDPLVARLEKDRALLSEQVLTYGSDSLQRKLERTDGGLQALRALNTKYGGSDQDIPPPTIVSRPIPPVQPNGVGSSISIGNSERNGTADYRKVSAELSSSLRATGQPLEAGRAISPRAARFAAGIRGAPIFGGVIIGNSAAKDSAQPLRAEILVRKAVDGDGNMREEPTVHVVVRQEGKTIDGYWSDATPTEMWAAYHVVRPNAEWKMRKGESGIVGKLKDTDDDLGSAWRFAVHPAVADTALARASMRLDMFPAAVQEQEEWQDVAALLPDFESYRWIDEAARIRVTDSQIQVVPAKGFERCLLRLRLWRLEVTESDAALVKTRFDKRLIAFKKAHGRAPSEEEKANILQEELGKLPGDEPEYDETKFLNLALGSFDALRTVDRFARAIAIFNWLSDALGRRFPAWSAECKPARSPVVATLDVADVLPPR